MNTLEHALYYRSLGWSVFPVRVFPSSKNGKYEKKPLVESWGQFMKRLATEEEIRQWYAKWPDAGIGIATGKLSNLAVLDFDLGSEAKEFKTISVKTGSQGKHFYFKYPKGRELRNSASLIAKNVDVRAEGGFVVAPPTHYSGNVSYEWIVSPQEGELADFPIDLMPKAKTLQDFRLELKAYQKEDVIHEGEGRNNAAASYAGYLLNRIEPALWESAAWPALQEWDKKMCNPSLGRELRVVFDSISKTDLRNNPNKIAIRAEEEKDVFNDPISIKQLQEESLPDIIWLVENIFSKGTINQISAAPNQWKSWLMQYMAIKIAKGGRIFDRFSTSQSGVLIVNEEDPKRMIQSRSNLLNPSKEECSVYFYVEQGIKLNGKTTRSLIEKMKNLNLSVIIFDSLSVIHEANENDAREMGKVFDWMRVFNREGFTVIFTNHHRKKPLIKGVSDNGQEQTRGSTVINAVPAGHITCEPFEVGNDRFITITQLKLKEAEKIKPFIVKIVSPEDKSSIDFVCDNNGDKAQRESASEKVAKEIIRVLESSDTLLSFDDLFNARIGGQSSIREALKELAKRDVVDSRKRKEVGMPVGPGMSATEKMYFLRAKQGKFIGEELPY